MQVMITHSSLVRTRVLNFSRWQIAGALITLAVVLMLLSGAVYHFVFLKAAREGWPVVSQIVKLIVRDEIAQRDRFMRENLDAMAQRVGELQAKVVKLEAVGERVSGLAGVKPEELQPLQAAPAAAKTGAAPAPAPARGGQGGPYIPLNQPSLEALNDAVALLEERTAVGTDLFTLIESRLFETKLQGLLVPSSAPVDGPVGSGFGFRSDPFTRRAALHTGLDFPAEPGTPIQAAAGGVVLSTDVHPAYGNLLEIDHGNGLVTRYAHTSRILVKVGDLVKRGQVVAEVGSTGRSTGPHLHFEVLLDSVPQNPARFLAGVAARR
jgi:murein DD-endopeptidase MepM/ murein hydrolase activator NlpD